MKGFSKQLGIQATELAIILLLFVTILLIILDGSRLMNVYISVSQIAREGARYGIVRGTDAGQDASRPVNDAPATESQIAAYLQNTHSVGIPINVVANWPDGKQPGSVIQVTVSTDFEPVIPLLGSQTLSSTSEMTIVY